MNERILVTGATGALGPCVVARLLAAGYRVRALVRKLPSAGLLPPTVECCLGDLTEPATLTAALQGCTQVVHLAALLHIVNPSPALQAEYERVNVQGTQSLVQAALQQGVERLLLISTIAVYGSQPDTLLEETTACVPDTFYGKSKLAAEDIVLQARRSTGKPLGVVLRLGAVYGSRVKGNYQRLLFSLAKGRFVPIGRGENRRSLIYEEDVAAAVLLAMCAERALGQVYNVTDGQYHPVREIIEAICVALDRSPPRLTIPIAPVRLLCAVSEDLAKGLRISSPVRRATLDKYTEEIRVDSRKIREQLGFRPEYDLQSGWRAAIKALQLD
ncbi:MAG: NAD-dependent epimerase/dehydratase family protein [Caldilineaceae bacterium]